MRVLGLETSCDETAVAVYDGRAGLLAHEVYSQVELQAAYGGVVPELASRDHLRKLMPLLRKVIAEGGGPSETLGLVFPGGPAGPPLLAGELDTPLDPVVLRSACTSLGTGAILVVGASACPLAIAASVASFFEREACGQCPPCTVGTASLARILRALEGGTRGRATCATCS